MCALRPPSVARPQSWEAGIFTHRQAHTRVRILPPSVRGRGRDCRVAPTAPTPDLLVRMAIGGYRAAWGQRSPKTARDRRYGPELSPQFRRTRRSEGLFCFTTFACVFAKDVNGMSISPCTGVARIPPAWARIWVWAAQVTSGNPASPRRPRTLSLLLFSGEVERCILGPSG